MRTRNRTSRDTFSSNHPRLGARTAITVLVLTLLFPMAAWAGPIDEAGFSDPTVTTFDGLGLPFFNAAPVEIEGHSISSDSGLVRYMAMGSGNCITAECIGTNEGGGYLDIVLAEPKPRAGIWVGLSTATVAFYDESDSLIGSIDVTPVSGQAMAFAGWEADAGAIARIRIVDTDSNALAVFVDNLMVEEGSADPPPDPTPDPIPNPTPDLVTIDIRPGSKKNPINLSGGGVVPVAVLTTDSFNAAYVDPSTVTLAGASVHVRGNGNPSAIFKDVDGDGDTDLLLHIEVREMELAVGDVEATLIGMTDLGGSFEGTDSVHIVP